MGLRERVFLEFVRANGLVLKPDFFRHRKLYVDSCGDGRTADELMGSLAFVGFVDGIQGKPYAPPKVPLHVSEESSFGSDKRDVSVLGGYDSQYFLGGSLSSRIRRDDGW